MSSEQPIPPPTLIDRLTAVPGIPQAITEERHRVLQTALSKSRTLLHAVIIFKATSASEISIAFKETVVANLVPILALRNLIPNGHSTLEPLLSELHHIHSEAARPTQPPPPPPSAKLRNSCAIFRRLRHGHGVMGFRYVYHCLLARPGAQAETLLRRQRSKAEDVEGRGEAQVQYALNILQSRLEMLVAELEKAGVVVVEEEEVEEDSVDEQDLQKPSLIAALAGDPTLSPEQVQERHTLLKDTLSTSRILSTAIVDFGLDLSRSRAKVIHLQASLDANHHNIRVLQNVVRKVPQYTLGYLLFEIYCLHRNAQQPIDQWRPGAKIKRLFCPGKVQRASERKDKSWFTTAHDGGISSTLKIMQWRLQDLIAALELEGVKIGEDETVGAENIAAE